MATRFTAHSPRSRFSIRIASAALVGVLLAGMPAAAEPPEIRRAALRATVMRGPGTDGRIPNYKVNRQLYLAFQIALKKVGGLSSCQELFDQLGADGIEVLANTTYVLAHADWERKVCRSASAFTTIGGSKVWLCGYFGWLSDSDGAEILLHEALHSAGLGEQPLDPEGPTAAEIDEMVKNKCGF